MNAVSVMNNNKGNNNMGNNWNGAAVQVPNSNNDSSSSSALNNPSVALTPAARYPRTHKLGEGTYGTVYRCHDKLLNRDVAIKIGKENSKCPGIPAVTVREISLLRELRHPCVVRLHDIFLDNDHPSLVFEYMDQDLKAMMDRRMTPILGEKLKVIMYQLCAGLNACHTRRIVHRDVKPMNILVSKDEKVAKLADFGLGRAFCLPLQTYTGALMTPLYRAPEVILGDTHYLPAVDIWSLGCTFAELATKRALFYIHSANSEATEVPQMMLMFSKLGTPNEVVWPGVSKLPYFHSEFPKWEPKPLSDLVSTLDAVGLDLLGAMLTYCPERRITAYQAMQHPWFDDVRDKCEESIRQRERKEMQERELESRLQFSRPSY